MARKSAAHRLDAAREAHEAATKQIAALEAERNAALLADDDDLAATLFAKLESLRAIVRGHVDKAKLLEGEAEQERKAAILRSHQALVGRFEKTLEGSDADLTVAADLIAQAWKKITTGIEKREKARMAFSVRSPHARAAAEAIDGCAMAGHAVTTLLAFEFWRLSARPPLGGAPGARPLPALPGALCPRIDLQLTPEKITPFAEKIRAASAFAVKTLRDELGGGPAPEADTAAPVAPAPQPSAPTRSAEEIQKQVQAEAEARDAALPPDTAPVNGGAQPPVAKISDFQKLAERGRTAAELHLATLLERQAELSKDVTAAGDKAYAKIVTEIATAQAAVNAEKGNFA